MQKITFLLTGATIALLPSAQMYVKGFEGFL